jgi:TolB-like protein/DNA-binding winged helix-turn-helix (wHTH) protein/cytochrome c-type biogenesis protein CcmH/NrfG
MEIMRFGPFALDPASLQLTKEGRRVRLPPQPAKVLAVLAGRAGEVVTREELRQTIWGSDTFVDFDQGLTFCVKRIREALGDSADRPRYLETIPKQGYRFIAQVAADPPRAAAPAEIVAPPSPPQRKRWRAAAAAILVLAAAGVGYAGWTRHAGPPAGTKTLAVLPFDNLSGDAAQEYFSAGFTEDLITELARINPGTLSVIARTSVKQFAKGDRGAREIGRSLGAEYLVEGSVRRTGDRVRVTAQLIAAADQTHVWAETYDRDVRDALILQRELADAIAAAIRVALVPGARRPSRQADPEVYQAYLKGRFFWNQRRADGYARAFEYFGAALKRDPSFAPAYAGIGDLHNSVAAFREALSAARRAIELDASLAEAYVTAGHARMHLFDWTGAAESLQRAVDLDPSYTPARYVLAEYLVTQGRFDEAIVQARRAVALEPAAAIPSHALGTMYYYARRFPEALAEFRAALELDPNHTWSHARIGQALEQEGHLEEAAREFAIAGRPLPLARVRARLGAAADARAFLDAGTEGSFEERALLAVALGDRDRAIRLLEQAVAQPSYDVVYLAVDPKLDALRADPRFPELLRRAALLER